MFLSPNSNTDQIVVYLVSSQPSSISRCIIFKQVPDLIAFPINISEDKDFQNLRISNGLKKTTQYHSVQFSSVAQSCPTLCDPMNRSTPGLPVHHHLPDFTQTHIHRVSNASQPSHPLSFPLLLPPIPPSIRVFSNELTLCMRWPKYWSFSFSISSSKETPGTDLL